MRFFRVISVWSPSHVRDDRKCAGRSPAFVNPMYIEKILISSEAKGVTGRCEKMIQMKLRLNRRSGDGSPGFCLCLKELEHPLVSVPESLGGESMPLRRVNVHVTFQFCLRAQLRELKRVVHRNIRVFTPVE